MPRVERPFQAGPGRPVPGRQFRSLDIPPADEELEHEWDRLFWEDGPRADGEKGE